VEEGCKGHRWNDDDVVLDAFERKFAMWPTGPTVGCMVKGQKVVCINDTFPALIRALYKQLPVKGNTYTIREVFLGREKIVKGGDTATVGLLLSELTNPPDPFHQGQQELGFTSERFAPMEELPPEEAEVGELVGAGAEKHQGGFWSN
jgi:hypothetical protein